MKRTLKGIIAVLIALCVSAPCVKYFNYKDALSSFSEEKYISDLASIYRKYDKNLDSKDENDPLALNRLVVSDYNGKYYGSVCRAWDKKHKIGILQYKTREDAQNAIAKINSDGLCAEGDSVAKITDGSIDENDDAQSSSAASISGNGTFCPSASEYVGTTSFINNIAMKKDDILVATVDTGVMYDHESIADRFYSRGVDLSSDGCDDAYYDSSMQDTHYGHGTMVSGIIADNTPDNVKLLPVKTVAFGQSSATASALLNGFNYAYDAGADVISCSLATSGCEYQLSQIVSKARNKGICVCASAGNEGTEIKDRFPSATPYAITVGYIDTDEKIDPKSNYGDSIDFCAPGRKIISTSPVDGKSGFRSGSGSSFAAPYVSACCACLKSIKKDLSRDDIYNTLCDFSKDLGDLGYDIHYGHGAVNIGNIVYSDDSYIYKIPQGTLEVKKTVDYTADTQPWRRFADRILNVKVANTIDRIGNYNFYNMKSASFDMKDSYDKIGSFAFYGCGNIKKYTCTIDCAEVGTGAFGGINDFTLEGYRNTPAETYALNEDVKFNALGCKHNYKRVVYEPTKSTQGYTLYTCTVCGDSYKGAYIEPKALESGKCGENLTYTFYDTGRLTIDGSGDMYDYTGISAPWSGYKDKITVIQIKDNAGKISPFAFYGCDSITRFFVSENNKTYFDYENELVSRSDNSLALAVCSTKYTVPDYVKNINASAFSAFQPSSIDGNGYYTKNRVVYDSCGNIVMALSGYNENTLEFNTNINIYDYAFIFTKYPEAVKSDSLSSSIGKYAVGYYYDGKMNKTDLKFLTVKQSKIYAYADENGFIADTGISGKCGDDISWRYDETSFKFTLSGSGKMYDYSARSEIPYCDYISKMTSAEIDERITSLSPYAFNNAFRLFTLTMPLSIAAPDSTVWDKCVNIKTLTLTLGSGIMDDYEKADGTLLYEYTPWYLSRKTIKSFSLDENVKKITKYAFRNCLAISSLTFNCVEEIEDFAFISCSNLKTVTNYCKTTVYSDHSLFSYRFGSAAPGTYPSRTLRAYSDSSSRDLTLSNGVIEFESLGCGHSRNSKFLRQEQDADDEYITNNIYLCADCNNEFVKDSLNTKAKINISLVNLKGAAVKGAEIYIDSVLAGTTDKDGKTAFTSKTGEHTLEVKLHDVSIFGSSFTAKSATDAKIQIRYANYINDRAVNGKDYAYAMRHGFDDKTLFDFGLVSSDDNKIIYEN